MPVDLHPRLAVNALSSFRSSFAEDLVLWDALGVRRVAPFIAKLDAHGYDDAVAALVEGGYTASSVVGYAFELRDPSSWDETRAGLVRTVDAAVALGASCAYMTSGRPTLQPWGEVLAAFTEAVAPVLAHARDRGISFALEPAPRPEVSFVHTVRDAIDVCDGLGIGIVADIGACWLDRELEISLADAGDRLSVVQVCDGALGTFQHPVRGRMVPGDGEMPIERFLSTIAATGYPGWFELEILGPAIESEGYEAAIRRGIERTNDLLERTVG